MTEELKRDINVAILTELTHKDIFPRGRTAAHLQRRFRYELDATVEQFAECCRGLVAEKLLTILDADRLGPGTDLIYAATDEGKKFARARGLCS